MRVRPRCVALNEGRGVCPGDTDQWPHVKTCSRRSTKAGASAPATPAILAGSGADDFSLNEGRGVCPGDTSPT